MSQDAILRGNRARQITEDPLFAEAFQGLEKGAIDRLAACDVTDKERLQALAMSLQTIRTVKHIFGVWMAEGEDAAKREIAKQHPSDSFIDRIARFRRRA